MLTPEFLAVIVLTCLAVVSPGPDFIVTSRNTLVAGRITGLATALGVGLGLSVHVAAAVVGVGVLLTGSTLAFTVAKILGGLYLIWLGIRTFRLATNDIPKGGRTAMTPAQGLFWGFVTNATNPKTAIFVVSLFLTVVSPQTSRPRSSAMACSSPPHMRPGSGRSRCCCRHRSCARACSRSSGAWNRRSARRSWSSAAPF